MMRHLFVAAVALVVGIGIVDPYACVQYSSGGSLRRPVPKKARARLERTAAAALSLVPSPPPPYVRQADAEGMPTADEKAPWDDGSDRWLLPGTARAAATWIWASSHDGGAGNDATPDLAVRVFVNGDTDPPTSLESVGDAPRLLAMDDATAVEVTTIGASRADGDDGPRAAAAKDPPALSMTADQAAHAVTVIRIVVADPMTERALRAQAEGRAPLRAARKPVRDAGRIESITVEIYGGKHDVESLAAEVPASSLRALLDR